MCRRNSLALLSVATLALICSTAVQAQAKPKVAILGLEVIDSGSGIEPRTAEVAKALTEALRDRPLRGAGPFSKAPNSDKDLLEMKLLSDCASEKNRCMAAIGKELGADLLMYGKIQKRRDGYQVTIKLLDVNKRTLVRTTVEKIQLDDVAPERILHWSRILYSRLAGEPDSGTLAIKANVSSGSVYIDGDIKGSLASGELTIQGVKMGKHLVRIEADGHKPFEIEVQIGGGETVPMEANLESMATDGIKDPKKPGGGGGGTVWKIATWTLVVGAGVSGVLAGVNYVEMNDIGSDKTDINAFQDATNIQIADDEQQVCDRIGLARDMLDPSDTAANSLLDDVQARCDEGDSAATKANIFGGIAIAAAAAAGFAFYKGYLSSGSSSQERAAKSGRKSSSRTVQITPTITPTHLGAGVKIEF